VVLEEEKPDIIVGKGISNALMLFGSRGMLSRSWNRDVSDQQGHLQFYKSKDIPPNQVIKGRSKDQTVSKQLREHGLDPAQENDRVKL
jgi:hypothetical protein